MRFSVDNKSKEYWRNTLQPLTGKIRKQDYIGFDVETFGVDNKFYSGCFYYYKRGVEKFEYFTDKYKMLSFILRREFRNKTVVATNLSFDLSVLFWGTKYWNNIKLITRGSDVLMASYDLGNNNGKIKFIDTFNFVKLGVAKLGDIIGVKKFDSPSWIGDRKPLNNSEELELKLYNIRDSKISCDFMYFLQEGINDAGGNIKVTIASTALDVWRRGHLKQNLTKEEYFIKDGEVKDIIFNAYYGGRTEVFKRGMFNDVNYYDINSLYPSVMTKKFPLPQSIKKVYYPDISNVLNFEGVSECVVTTPSNIDKPLLPIRLKDGKLVFPIGRFKGCYNHVELRRALKLGYKLELTKQYIYTQTFYPFKSYVNLFYSKRLEYKKQGSNMELVCKLLLNSLYGKFAQKNRQQLSIKMVSHLSDDEYLKFLKSDSVNPSFIIKDDVLFDIKKTIFNGIFSFPILSSYTTSYARLLMYDYLEKYDVIYMDTDSIVTRDDVLTSQMLGDMKLEGRISKSIFIKPKMYLMDDDIKVKGVSKCSVDDFNSFLNGGSVDKMKFSKLRESIRRGMNPNTRMMVSKSLNLEDTKRDWGNKKFNEFEEQISVPIEVDLVDSGNVQVSGFNFNNDLDKHYYYVVDEYLSNNVYLKKHFKGSLKELKSNMCRLLDKGVDLDLVDWLSMSSDKPISEYVDDYLSVGGI